MNELSYILLNFSKLHGIDLTQMQISYGIDNLSKIQIYKANVDFSNTKLQIDTSGLKFKQWKGVNIPFLFDFIDKNEEIISDIDGIITINYDIIAASFYLLTGFQELDVDKRDSLGRFMYSRSIQYKLGIIQTPVVNYYFDILKKAISLAYNKTPALKISFNHTFTACLTHDIDNCENAWFEGSFHAIKKGDLLTPLNLLFHKFILRQDKWFNFETIHSIENKYNATSSFYFLCRKGKYLGKSNADYDIRKKKFIPVLKHIETLGSEVGIHGSFGTHNDVGALLADLKKLKRKVYGGRFHFLEFEVDKTPEVLENADLVYDSTLGFPEHPGFRNSFCYPFLLYDFQNNRASEVWEIPLILMDASLQSKNYMNTSIANAPKIIDKLMDEVRKFNGIFTILWHTTFFSDYKYKGWKAVYIYFLEKCKQQNAYFSTAKDIIAELNKS